MQIIIFSTQPWNDSHWTNKQHIAHRLSQKHEVIYYFDETSLIGRIKEFFTPPFSRNKFHKLYQKKNPNLHIFQPYSLLPSRFSIMLFKITKRINLLLLQKLLNQLNFEEPILWFYEPTAVYYLDKIDYSFSLYDCVDEYQTLFNAGNKKYLDKIAKDETRLLKNTDLVITTSRPLYKKKKKYNSNTHYIHNVGEASLFKKANSEDINIHPDIQNIPAPIVGYHGALSYYKVDFDLIYFISNSKPDWSIVLIGDYIDIDKPTLNKLSQAENIYLLGKKEYRKLPQFIKAFEVCIIPYLINQYTTYCFPLKFFEYMATGKPIVTTALPSLEEYKEYIEYSQDKKEFLKYLENIIASDKSFSQSRVNLAQNFTWESRLKKIMKRVHNAR